MKDQTFVLSLGGSLIVPKKGIDAQFLKKFHEFIVKQVKLGRKFYIIAGGGRTCRDYNEAARKVVKVPDEDLDWLGIHSSRLNAHLLRTIFRDIAYPEVIKNPTIHFPENYRVVIGGGWKPGWSTDYVATMIAQEYEIKTIINLSNINCAYTADPKKDKKAEKIKNISWPAFRKIVGDEWKPGLSMPFDPIASRQAQQLGLKVVILNGKKFKNLEKCLNGGKCEGTVIE